MILHSIVPIDYILPAENTVEYSYKRVNNSYIQGTKSEGKFTVTRLISTDPKMYLDPHYNPGQTLK